MNLLLSGPPASGKSRAALERFRAIPNSLLLSPTATMAEHLRHELARSGFPVRPSRVGTLAQLLDSWDVPKPVPRALLYTLIAEALERSRPARFSGVREFRGFHEAVASVLDEVPLEAFLAGKCGEDLGNIHRIVEESLVSRGLALRSERLRAAAAKVLSGIGISAEQFVFDGFFTFSPPELELLEALAGRAAITVTLPEGPSGEAARRRLLSLGFSILHFSQAWRNPRATTFSAATPEREAEEIARRILKYKADGRHFRDIGVVLRARDPYGPLIETSLARFGIPARSYFSAPLASHPAIAYLSGLVNNALNGWDLAPLGRLLRMPVTGVGATADGDRFDFALREQLPGIGLHGLPEGPAVLNALAGIEKWARERVDPASWATRLKTLGTLLPKPVVTDRADRDQVDAWRSTAAALDAFDEALHQGAASFLGAENIPLVQFWKQIETTLAIEPLRIEDRRRDVVHVLDVFEARQWELPVVFVCGLLEREFPQYHREDPILGDALRRSLGLATAAQQQGEERFLFELALTRATEETVLSYPRFNEKGDETLSSFFLNNGDETEACQVRVRPAPTRSVAAPAPHPIQETALLRQLARTHRKLSPTGIESFLQCPFQFFAGKTLRLKQRPPAPRDRLDILLQANILHRALAEWIGAPLLGAAVFDRVFEDECSQKHVPANYRTEAVRLVLLRHFEGFLNDSQMLLGWRCKTEEMFNFTLTPAITIRGRIDRLEIGPQNQALVIDYKYSPGAKIRERVNQSEAGNLVQGGLYLMAAERALGLHPVGMLYCGLKKDVTWGGWHLSLPGLERIGESRTPEALRELMEDATRRAVAAHEAITSGHVSAHPADDAKCRFCDFRDACRIETLAAETAVGAGS